MNNLFALDELEKNKGKIVTYKVQVYDKENGVNYDEYIQGRFKSVNRENQSITIEQHLPFINLILKGDTTVIPRELKLGDFTKV